MMKQYLIPILGLLIVFFVEPVTATEPEIRVRAAAVAGSWYPGDAQALGKLVDKLLAEASPQSLKGIIRALITPHAGYRYSGAGAAAGYKLIQGQSLRRVIVLGPAHAGGFHGLSIADATHYETPLGRIPLDLEAIAQLRENSLVVADDWAHQREHSIEIQLPLLQRVLAPGWTLLPILVGHIDDYASAAKLLRPYTDDNTLIVVSGDFTHYGPHYHYMPFPLDGTIKERLKLLDMGAYEKIAAHDAAGFMAYRDMTGITACAFDPVMVLLHLLPESATSTLVNYYTSGEVTGDYRHSVSYLTVAVTNELPFSEKVPIVKQKSANLGGNLNDSQLQFLHQLARNAVEAAVMSESGVIETFIQLATKLPDNLRRPAGTFVTLKKHGHLRGCIGTIQSNDPLYRSVIINAQRAALHDPRFSPVQPDELAFLTIEVSVLSQPEPIASYKEFEVGKHGIILEKDGRSAVFLPEVALEQGWDREQTLSYLAKKAGLSPDAWKEEADYLVFTTQKYTEPQPESH